MIASERDILTGLANRRGFDHAVQQLISLNPNERFVVLYGDIDRFKVFNDHFGTNAGDQLLAAIGQEISRVLPEKSVAARLRADHFVCCMPYNLCDPERVLSVLDAWFRRYPVKFAFFVRLGVYEIDDPSMDVSLMTDRALLALRSAKTGHQSSKFVRFDESLRDSVVREQELAGEMADALKTGQFELYFQPQFCFTDGKLLGAEVLSRWQHPKKGLISPAEFIPVFERTGLISTLDYYVWDQACRCLRAWLDAAGPGNEARVPRLSVNLSRSDIYRDDLCDYLVGLIETYRLSFDLLHLEITESAYVEAPDQLTETVLRLQAAGFTVEMDDFGSGYSSLNALKDVPVDVLKLDLRFLDARNDTRGGVILASVVRMARWLDLPVIAEGVEFESQALFLSSIGSDAMQGFLFSRPVDRASYEQIMAQSECGPLERRRGRDREEFKQLWDAESAVALVFNSYVGPAALAEYDGSQFEVVRANDEFYNLLKLPLNVFARTVDEVFGNLCAEDRAAIADALDRAVNEDTVGECELRVRDRGDEFWVRATIKPLSRAGAMSSFLVVLDETTEKQVLRGRLRAAMDGVPGGLSFYQIEDQRITLLDFNDAMPDLVGMSREGYARLSENDPMALVVPEDRAAVDAMLDQLRSGTHRAECMVRIKLPSGPMRWLLLSSSLMHEGTDSLYLALVVLDVTDEKEKDLQYKLLAEQQQQLFETVPCGIVRFALSDRPHIESMNHAACQILRCESHDDMLAYVREDPLMPMDDESRVQMEGSIEKLLAGSPPIAFTSTVTRKDGTRGLVEGTVALAETLGRGAIVQCVFDDVTEERKETHRRELQRFTSVLCSVYAEIIEFDLARDTCQVCYSVQKPGVVGKPMPIDRALKLWLSHVPRQADQVALESVLEGFKSQGFEGPTSLLYRFEVNGTGVWYESTFLRVSETSVLCCNNDATARMTAEDERLSQHVGGIVGNLPTGIGVYDIDETGVRPRFVSDIACDMLGVARAEYDAIIAADEPTAPDDQVRAFLARHANEDKFEFSQEGMLGREDVRFMARMQGRATRLECGALRLYIVITDVTDEVRERRERAWQNERYRILSELTHSISFDYDSQSDTVLLYIDRTGNGMEAQVIPHYLETLSDTRQGVVHPDSIEAVRSMFESVRNGSDNFTIEYRADYYGRGWAWYRANLFVAHDAGEAWHLVGLIENIESERDLRKRAEHDEITGLTNYATTKDLVNLTLADQRLRTRCVCAVLDIDDFKLVNDSSGHIEGDALLHEVGVILRSSFRESDIVGRVGGDEFVLLLKDIDLSVAVKKLESVSRRVLQADVPRLHAAPSVSIGVYRTCAGDQTYRDVVVKADDALYRAKRSGKGRIVVYDEADETALGC